jgi:hypothetical protein
LTNSLQDWGYAIIDDLKLVHDIDVVTIDTANGNMYLTFDTEDKLEIIISVEIEDAKKRT